MNIDDLQREFKQYALLKKGMKLKTYKDITRVVLALAKFTGNRDVTNMTTGSIHHFFDHGQLERGWCPKTFRLYWQYLKSFFDWCFRQSYVTENPLLKIERPKLPKRLPRCLSQEDAKKILFQAYVTPWYSEWEKYRNETIIFTFLMTGLRLQELLNLKKADVDLVAGEIFVHMGKGSKDRIVPLHPRMQQGLDRYLRESEALGKVSPWFFHSSRSAKQLRSKDVRAICRRISGLSGVKFTPHMLRHTFAREMLDHGLDIFKLKEILGHSSISTTQIYASVSKKCLKDSIANLRLY